MNQLQRASIGFIVAPILPTLLLYVISIAMGSRDALPVLNVLLGYTIAFVFGIPLYLLLQHAGFTVVRSYILASMMPLVYLLAETFIVLAGNHMRISWQILMPSLVLAAYFMLASSILSLIVFKRKTFEAERFFMSFGLD